ncbi:NupC/NupG family nucleoside CNT transporter [Planctobacterium marinum]|uniref:Nucleoside permease n=1 Tax=Planctobacterium marinum TaxID=1631968 RepID=A0AA48KPF8_9ALTE|nr:nucleoside permease [Planctobacterium marinum]
MISLLGIIVLIGAAWLISYDRKSINWRTVGGAFAIQAGVGLLVLYFPPGKQFLLWIAGGVSRVLEYSQAGIDFLFGPIGDKSLGFVFAFNVLPVIVFFSALISVLYHLGIMSIIIKAIGGFLQKVLHTSKPESMNAAANIFVGQTEAPLVVKPFIPNMTRSELFALMVGGMASIAGSVMAGYAGMGVEIKYLVAASFMAAPGGLLMAKLVLPESGAPKDELEQLNPKMEENTNIFDAAAQGAASGLKIAANVGAMLLAFIALIALLNGLIGGIGGWFGMPELSFQMILGYVFQPLAWVLGVPWHEAQAAGSFIGQKLVVNEFVAYLDFIDQRENLSASTQAIVTFALCGFANFSSIAILMGGIGAMAPNRRKDLASLGLRAVIAASFANLMSAALAGFFISIS